MLRHYRERANITQRELGAHLGVCDMFISRIETGISDMPIKHYKKMSKFLNVSMECLIDERMKLERKRIRKALGIK